MRISLLISLCLLISSTVLAETIKVVDGDSLIVNDQMTRLIGIDAPEYFQVCYDHAGKEYFCGQKATEFMQKMIDEGVARRDKINCKKKDTDKYHRDLSICRIGKLNLNRKMVEAGWAVAYRHDWYEKDQQDAKNNRRGIWQGQFMRPELYRILKKYQKN